MSIEQEHAVAQAGVGAMLMVMGVGHIGPIGLIKEAMAGKKALQHAEDGPAKDLIKAAAEVALDRDSELGKQWQDDSAWEDMSKAAEIGAQLLDEALPGVSALPADQGAQVKRWAVEIAEHVAEAAKDKDTKEKVSDAEREQIASVRAKLGMG